MFVLTKQHITVRKKYYFPGFLKQRIVITFETDYRLLNSGQCDRLKLCAMDQVCPSSITDPLMREKPMSAA